MKKRFLWPSNMQGRTAGQMMLPLEDSALIPKEAVEIVEKVIRDMNIVLEQMVPRLRIGLKELSIQRGR